MASVNDRRIRDVRDIWNCNVKEENKENPRLPPIDTNTVVDNRTKHKYKTLERHLSMKKTIRKKMMRDLREIGDATSQENQERGGGVTAPFLDQIKNDQPPPESIEKPSLWKRLTKGWGH